MKQACIRAVLVLCVAANGTDAQSGDSAMAQRLDSIRKTRNVPALGAAFIRGDGSVTSAVVGVRKRGTDVLATTEDKWPLASNTKAMTATLLATLVEQGALTWETTLAEVFPELRAGFRGEFGAITVTHLLGHYGGLPRNFDGTGIRRTAPTPAGQRLNLVRKTGSQALRSAPGTKMEYSNLGYVIAGAVAERVGGKPWEALMRERVFAPLGMEGCGFGGALTNRDTEDVGGPAGTVRCSLADWGKFVLDQLRGEHGRRVAQTRNVQGAARATIRRQLRVRLVRRSRPMGGRRHVQPHWEHREYGFCRRVDLAGARRRGAHGDESRRRRRGKSVGGRRGFTVSDVRSREIGAVRGMFVF
jgi:CubicO group peptidase (beta-lactamase class C family)